MREFADLPAITNLDYSGSSTSVLLSRAAMEFKRNMVEESAADFDAALKLEPRMAGQLWQRGLTSTGR
jgi:hypothetical protein